MVGRTEGEPAGGPDSGEMTGKSGNPLQPVARRNQRLHHLTVPLLDVACYRANAVFASW